MSRFGRLGLVLMGLQLALGSPALCEAKKKSSYAIKPEEVKIVQTDARQHPWGVGLIIGDPTGVTVKYWLNAQNAWEFSLGSQLSLAGVGAHADYLLHIPVISDAPEAPIYIGGGAFLGGGGDQFTAGLRGVAGMTYIFSEPFDIFMQLSPTLTVSPRIDFYFTFSIGGRIYL